MKFTIAALTTLIASALAGPLIIPRTPPPATEDGPNKDQVYITNVNYNGNGCPKGTAAIDIFEDRKSFQILFQSYTASAGPGINIAEARKNCVLTVSLHYPGGFQYSVWSSDYRGYQSIAKGSTGYQKAVYYFSGETKQVSTETKLVGGKDAGDYLLHDEIPFTSTVWSPCGRSSGLTINSSVRIEGDRKQESFITNDVIDGKVEFKVGIKWQKCNKA